MEFVFKVADVNADGKTDVSLAVRVAGQTVFQHTVVDGLSVSVLTNALEFLFDRVRGGRR